MDKLDQRIIKMLIKDPKKPFLNIAKEIGISPGTPSNRYEKMIDDGILFGSSILLDLSKIGYQGKALLFLKANKKYDSETLIQNLSQIPNIFLVSEIIGGFDVLAIVMFKTMTLLKETVNRILGLASVEKVEVAITDDTIFPFKEEYCDIDPFK